MEYIDIETIDGRFQEHVWGGGLETGRETTYNLMFNEVTKFSHGQHIRTGGGGDVINFVEFDHVDQVVVGRLEDFDASRDEIRIEGETLDFNDLPDNARVVAYKGGHNDNDETQQWLLIDTAAGGKLFYTLEGARIDMDGNGGREADKTQEQHFLLEEQLPPDFADLPDVPFIDMQNAVPDGVSPQGGRIINDIDKDAGDVLAPVTGSARGDLIAGGLNEDTIEAGSGADQVWGGSGHDMLWGGNGQDTLWGGTGRDQLIGGRDADVLYGGHESDILSGWNGDDMLHGERGSDILYGHTGADTIFGGMGQDRLLGASDDDFLSGNSGNDTLIGGTGTDTMRGGDGEDVFEIRAGDLIDRSQLEAGQINDLDVIEDFTIGEDQIAITGFKDVTSAADISAARTTIDGDAHFFVNIGDSALGFLMNVEDDTRWEDVFAGSDRDGDGIDEVDENFLFL